MRRHTMDSYRCESRENCDNCEDIDDNGNDMAYAAAELAIGPMYQRKRVQLCAQCLIRLRELATAALSKYTDIDVGRLDR